MKGEATAMVQGYRGVFTVAKEEKKSKDLSSASFGLSHPWLRHFRDKAARVKKLGSARFSLFEPYG